MFLHLCISRLYSELLHVTALRISQTTHHRSWVPTLHPVVLQIQQLQPQFPEKPKISEKNLLSGV